MTCYCCSTKATHAIHLGIWREVCKFHLEEATEEETEGVWVRTIDNHLEVVKREQKRISEVA